MCAGYVRRVTHDEIADDGSTHPLAERLRPEPFDTRDKVAVLGTLSERMGLMRSHEGDVGGWEAPTLRSHVLS